MALSWKRAWWIRVWKDDQPGQLWGEREVSVMRCRRVVGGARRGAGGGGEQVRGGALVSTGLSGPGYLGYGFQQRSEVSSNCPDP